jgi:hypothetical protein
MFADIGQFSAYESMFNSSVGDQLNYFMPQGNYSLFCRGKPCFDRPLLLGTGVRSTSVPGSVAQSPPGSPSNPVTPSSPPGIAPSSIEDAMFRRIRHFQAENSQFSRSLASQVNVYPSPAVATSHAFPTGPPRSLSAPNGDALPPSSGMGVPINDTCPPSNEMVAVPIGNTFSSGNEMNGGVLNSNTGLANNGVNGGIPQSLASFSNNGTNGGVINTNPFPSTSRMNSAPNGYSVPSNHGLSSQVGNPNVMDATDGIASHVIGTLRQVSERSSELPLKEAATESLNIVQALKVSIRNV